MKSFVFIWLKCAGFAALMLPLAIAFAWACIQYPAIAIGLACFMLLGMITIAALDIWQRQLHIDGRKY